MPFFPEEASALPDGLSQELFDMICKTEPDFPDDDAESKDGGAPQSPPGTTRGRVRYARSLDVCLFLAFVLRPSVSV